MEIRTGSLDFTAPVSGSGPRTASSTVVFPRAIADAVAGLTGYWMGYAQSAGDHHVGRLVTELSTVVNDNTVEVTAALGVRDWSGDWDDQYQGTVDFAVLADLVSATAPPPRGDLVISGLEHNQAIQFWRASRYLDPTTVRPDNSIPLVQGKNTGLRVYVDYDDTSGLPAIANLTGTVEVQTGATTLTLQPINAFGTIQPRRDSQIDQTSADQTLNFMIPGAWCNGAITITCRVWDAADPSRPSAAFIQTLVFGNEAALNYYVVGINYTANPATAPPTLNQFLATHLADVVRTYPMSTFPVNGYQTIDYGETVTGPMPSSGCGSGFGDLLDRLADMQGSSDDIYVGLLGAGIMEVMGNQIGGCGRPKVVGIFLDRGMDLPHESGHALGRQHAPCTMNRCDPAPANPDPNYPQYGSLRSDSIGGFGFDPTSNTVFAPASTSDFMAYSGPNWVSAYNWSALAGAFALAPSSPGSHGIPGVQVPTLRLGLAIHRDRHVVRRPSFYFEGIQDSVGCGGCGRCGGCDCGGDPHFVLEIVDRHDTVLVSEPLFGGCDQGCGTWPKTYRQKIVWPEAAHRLKVWEGRDLIHTEDIPPQPKVTIREPEKAADGMRVRWQSTAPGKASKDELWYLVQWYDDEDESWRGVAPRQTTAEIIVPWSLLRGRQLRVRVLATTGVNTGGAEVLVNGDGGGNGTKGDAYQVLLLDHVPDPDGAPVTHPTAVLHAVAIDAAGKTADPADLSWYDENGALLASGPALDTRQLPPGRHTVRAAVRARTSGSAVSTGWQIEVGGGNPLIYLATAPRPAGPPPAPHTHPHD
jgi:hypothetical protein